MRKMTGHLRTAASPAARGAPRYAAAAARTARTGGGLIFLAMLFWMFFYQNLPDNLMGMAANGEYSSSNVTDRVVKVVMLVFSIYVILSKWSVTRAVGRNFNAGSAALLSLCLLSAVWSFDPNSTLLRFVSLLTVFLVSFAITVSGWHARRFQQVALPPLMLILLASLAMGAVDPKSMMEIGTDLSQLNAWHGITHGKNEFGMMASIAAIICANLWLARERRAFWPIAGTAVSFLCLILSRSNASLFATLLAMMFMVMVMRVPTIRERFSTHVAVGLTLTILLYELAIQDVVPGTHTLISPIMHLTGKDATFSGRTFIWNIVKDHINYAPYLGSGYGAYWLGPVPGSPSYIFMPVMYFYPSEAHNGYLDIVNDLGLVGLGCVLVFIFWYIRQALLLMRSDRSQGALYLGLLLQQMVVNMSESEWISRGSTSDVMILASICLSRSLLDTQLARRSR